MSDIRPQGIAVDPNVEIFDRPPNGLSNTSGDRAHMIVNEHLEWLQDIAPRDNVFDDKFRHLKVLKDQINDPLPANSDLLTYANSVMEAIDTVIFRQKLNGHVSCEFGDLEPAKVGTKATDTTAETNWNDTEDQIIITLNQAICTSRQIIFEAIVHEMCHAFMFYEICAAADKCEHSDPPGCWQLDGIGKKGHGKAWQKLAKAVSEYLRDSVGLRHLDLNRPAGAAEEQPAHARREDWEIDEEWEAYDAFVGEWFSGDDVEDVKEYERERDSE